MPQIHGPIQHLRRSLGPGLQTIQAIHGPPTLGPVVVPVIGNRTRGPSPRKHGVGQRGNPSGEGTKQVGKKKWATWEGSDFVEGIGRQCKKG